MFAEMRSAVQIPKDQDILDYIHGLPAGEQEAAFGRIQAIERAAMRKQVPQAGLVTLMERLDEWGVRKGICTRNFEPVSPRFPVRAVAGVCADVDPSAPVTHLLETHLPSHIDPFHPIVTRDFKPPKPSPAALLHIAHSWGIVASPQIPDSDPRERLLPMVMVGDSVDDIASGWEAGALTVLVRSAGKEELEGDERVDVVLGRLDELVGLLERGLRGRMR